MDLRKFKNGVYDLVDLSKTGKGHRVLEEFVEEIWGILMERDLAIENKKRGMEVIEQLRTENDKLKEENKALSEQVSSRSEDKAENAEEETDIVRLNKLCMVLDLEQTEAISLLSPRSGTSHISGMKLADIFIDGLGHLAKAIRKFRDVSEAMR